MDCGDICTTVKTVNMAKLFALDGQDGERVDCVRAKLEAIAYMRDLYIFSGWCPHWLMVAARALNSWFDSVHSRPILLVAPCQGLLPQARGHLVPFRSYGRWRWKLEDGAKSEG